VDDLIERFAIAILDVPGIFVPAHAFASFNLDVPNGLILSLSHFRVALTDFHRYARNVNIGGASPPSRWRHWLQLRGQHRSLGRMNRAKLTGGKKALEHKTFYVSCGFSRQKYKSVAYRRSVAYSQATPSAKESG
jgi:hypothetical protein